MKNCSIKCATEINSIDMSVQRSRKIADRMLMLKHEAGNINVLDFSIITARLTVILATYSQSGKGN